MAMKQRERAKPQTEMPVADNALSSLFERASQIAAGQQLAKPNAPFYTRQFSWLRSVEINHHGGMTPLIETALRGKHTLRFYTRKDVRVLAGAEDFMRNLYVIAADDNTGAAYFTSLNFTIWIAEREINANGVAVQISEVVWPTIDNEVVIELARQALRVDASTNLILGQSTTARPLMPFNMRERIYPDLKI